MKAHEIEEIKLLTRSFKLKEAEEKLLSLKRERPQEDEIYYLLGNIHHKQNHWQEALQYYAHAIEINPESPALQAREMIIQIMSFYDKERYNV